MSREARRLVKIRRVLELRSQGITKTYEDIKQGTLPPPIKRGRCSLWVEDEIAAINAAEIAGSTTEEITQLVSKLVAARSQQVAA